MDCSPPGSPAYGTSQARILEWLTVSFSGDLPSPRIEPASYMSLALAGEFFTASTPGEGNGNSLQYSCLGNPTGTGQRSLVGHSSWGHKDKDTTQRLITHTHTHTHTRQTIPAPTLENSPQSPTWINTTSVVILNLYVWGGFSQSNM